MAVKLSRQTWLNFDIDHLLADGMSSAYVGPFARNNEALAAPEVILANLRQLYEKSLQAAEKGLEVYPLFVTINHPEGNFEVPSRYRIQRNLDGSPRPEFICFRDAVRQAELIRFATYAAELGFGRIAFDDDLRDAFCYCDQHLAECSALSDKSRDEVAVILNDILDHPEGEELRLAWYHYKSAGMKDFALRLTQAVQQVNPDCQFGIFNSAKRCLDFSGRHPVEWLQLFDTKQAPAFVRLAGECYFDDVLHLAQSTGWHAYFNQVFDRKTERMLEITSAAAIEYRSPGTVSFEAEAVVAATGVQNVHCCWPEGFDSSTWNDANDRVQDRLSRIVAELPSAPTSPLSLYIGHQLGAYTPADVAGRYGASCDPLSAYNITSLVGLPITVIPTIDNSPSAVLCCSYISRQMIQEIDAYVSRGGVAILDATAARCYAVYGGQTSLALDGPRSGHRYEIGPSGERETLIAHCGTEMTFLVSARQVAHEWVGYDLQDEPTGVTSAIVPRDAGRLILLGFDLSRSGPALIRPEWRRRLVELLSRAQVTLPVYWNGPVGVQCNWYETKAALINYNTNKVHGELVVAERREPVSAESRSVTLYDL